MVRPDLVEQKLAALHRYLSELEPHRNLSLEDYIIGGDRKRSVERLLQLLVETAVDLNTHIATELEGVPPTDYTDSFRAMARVGAIPPELATRLAPSAGLRNALVHEYGDIDDAKVHASIRLALDVFKEYPTAVVAWLDGQTNA